LTHVVVNAATRNPYNRLPTWLDEGLATLVQADEDPALAEALARARREHTLLPLRTLESGFPTDDTVLLAYAQSAGAVQFLLDAGGTGYLGRLLAQFPAGVTYDDALEAVYGVPTDTVDTLWRITLDSNGATVTLGQSDATVVVASPAAPTRTPVLAVPVPASPRPPAGSPTVLPAVPPEGATTGPGIGQALRVLGIAVALGIFLGVFIGRWRSGRARR
jgi:hypothetical protein